MRNILFIAICLVVFSCEKQNEIQFKMEKPIMDLYILRGQSLMDGSAPANELPSGWGAPITDGTNTAYCVNHRTGVVETLDMGYNNAYTLGEWGIEIPLGWDYVESGRSVMIVKVAVNGAPLCAESGRPDWNIYTNELYRRLVRNTKIGMQWLSDAGYDINPVAIITKQGERDARDFNCSQNYLENLKLDYADFVGLFGFYDIKIIEPGIHSNIPLPDYQYFNMVNQAKIDYCSENQNATYLNTDNWGLKPDLIHINGYGTLQFYQDVKTILQ